MNFSSASKVLQTIRSGDPVERIRGENRVKINDHANCVPPFKAEAAKKLGIKINVNFGELMVLLQKARLQFLSAFWGNLNFFKVKIPKAPPDHQADWEEFITDFINKKMRDSIEYFEVHNAKWAAVTTHGMGPTIWYDPYTWCPEFRAISDIRIATDVTLNLKNLEWFADKHVYTPGELMDVAMKSGSKWDKRAVANILENLKNVNWGPAINNYNWYTDIEKIHDLMRQAGGYYSSDAMPGIPLWRFYFKDTTDPENKGWFLRILSDQNVVGSSEQNFLWPVQAAESSKDGEPGQFKEKPVADKLSKIFHCQWGDLNTDAPFKVQAMRSLGFALMEPCFYSNLTTCRLVQHLNDQFNILLRVTDPVDKARALVQEFSNLGVLNPGVAIVPQAERHQVDAQLVEMVSAKTKQLQSEASSTYTQQSDTGTQKESTAFEVSVKLQQVNALMSGLLMKAFIYEKPSYVEICRRFCIEGTTDEDCQEFQEACREEGIPIGWMDIKKWDIQVETPPGMGNATAAMAESQQMMANRAAFGPQAQAEILHDFVLVNTKNPQKAGRLAPINAAQGATPGQKVAEADFSVLMRGMPVNTMQGVSVAEQLQTLIGLLSGEVSTAEQNGNMSNARDIQGMQNVEQHCQGLIQQIEPDQAQQQVVEWAKNALMPLMNAVKGFQQRLQEQQQAAAEQAQQGQNQEAQAKVLAIAAKAHIDEQIKTNKDAQQRVHQAQSFAAEQQRKDAAASAENQRKNSETAAEQARQNIEAVSEVRRKNMMANADVEIAKKKAKAAPKPKPTSPATE